MRYGIVLASFWTGETGRALRAHPDAQRLGAYLLTCDASNLIGLYHLTVVTAAREVGLTVPKTRKAFAVLQAFGFAEHDELGEWVWVREMARFQIGERLSEGDNRRKRVLQCLKDAAKSPFLRAFYERYREPFALPALPEAPSKPLPSPLEAPSEGLEYAYASEYGSASESGSSPSRARASDQPALPLTPTPPDAPFAEFWLAYPKKVAKQEAREAWAKLKPDRALLQRILGALTWQRRKPDWLKDRGQMIPHPATWLNKKRWEDEPMNVPDMSDTTVATLTVLERWEERQQC